MTTLFLTHSRPGAPSTTRSSTPFMLAEHSHSELLIIITFVLGFVLVCIWCGTAIRNDIPICGISFQISVLKIVECNFRRKIKCTLLQNSKTTSLCILKMTCHVTVSPQVTKNLLAERLRFQIRSRMIRPSAPILLSLEISRLLRTLHILHIPRVNISGSTKFHQVTSQ